MSRQPVRAPWFVIGLLTIMAVLVLTGCSAGGSKTSKGGSERKPSEEAVVDPNEEAPDAPKEEKWHEIAEVSGEGSGDTGSFEIKTSEYWRVTLKRENTGGSSTASLYLAGESPGTAPHHGQVTGSGADPVTANFAETGKFFFRIDGEGPWKVVVEEMEAVYGGD